MKTTGLACRLGLDGNPLRRRIDKIAACLAALLMAVLATTALGTVLWWLAGAGRWMLDRRRLADGEAAWAAIAPSGPGASGREASPDDLARGHRGAARAGGLMGQARAGGRRGKG
jgi:hypothetical protein